MLINFIKNLFLISFGIFLFNASLFCGNLPSDCGQYTFSRVNIKHLEHKGMGFDQGYSTLSLFLCPDFKKFGAPFFDARLHVFNNAYLASNLGIGSRFSNRKDTLVLGLNAYYDYRNYKSFSSHQAAGGFEILGTWFDFRFNGYYPFSGKYQQGTPSFHAFKGHYALIQEHVRYALPCVDAEIGFNPPDAFNHFGLYASVGSYYLFTQKAVHHNAGHVFGGRARASFTPITYFSFGGEYTYDHLYGSRGNGFLSINIPLGPRKRKHSTINRYPYEKSRCDLYVERMEIKTQDVIRNEIIPFYSKNYIEPSDEYFVFVNNKNLAANEIGSGKGTFENPYTTLALAQKNSSPEDIIYVFLGDGTSRGYDKGFDLQTNQTLTSSGLDLALGDPVTIPAFTPNQFPTLTNTANAPVITASSTKHVTIRGFNIEGPDSPFYLTGENTAIAINNSGLTFSNNKAIGGNLSDVIYHLNPIGKTLISESTLIAKNSTNNDSGAIHIENLEQNITESYQILNNTIRSGQGLNGISLDNFCNRITIQNNTIDASGDGSGLNGNSIITTCFTSNLSVTTINILDNTIFAGNNSNGIYFLIESNSIIHGTISNNTITTPKGSTGPAILILSASGKQPICLNISGNRNASSFTFQNLGTSFMQLAPSDNGTRESFQNNNNPHASYKYQGKIYFVPAGSPCPPLNAVYVDNISRSSVEDGSFVHPWKSLAEAQNHSHPNDVIYVFQGNGQTTPGYSSGFVLKDGQMIVGSGTPFNYLGATIAPLTEGMPKITNIAPNSNVIDTPGGGLSRCSIIGLDILGLSNGYGINCNVAGGENILIRDNLVEAPKGILINDSACSANVFILNNTVATFGGSPLTIHGTKSSTIQNNFMNNTSLTTGPGLVWNASSGNTSLNIDNNSFMGFVTSTSFSSPSNNLSLNITGNSFISNLSTNYHILADLASSPLNCTIEGNDFTSLVPLTNNRNIILRNTGKSVYNLNNNFFAPGYSAIEIDYPSASACITQFHKNNAEIFFITPGSGGSGTAQINVLNQSILQKTNNPHGIYNIQHATFVPPGTTCP